MSWHDTPLSALLGTRYPIIQAPMAGATTPAMAVAAAGAGALGSLGCAMLQGATLRAEAEAAVGRTNGAVNLNFFVHERPRPDAAKAAVAVGRLQPWYRHFGLGDPVVPAETHYPFDAEMCGIVEAVAPRVVSFHFGLPDAALITRLKARGIVVLSSATSVAEARWLEAHGADAIIAQGAEAGGHNGWFMDRGGADVAGLFALLPRIVDAVEVPVIAAGGIGDGRGVAAAMTLGAAGVQVGTAFLATPESGTAEVHKRAVLAASGDDTIATEAFSGRRARSIVNAYAREMAGVRDWPDFPLMNAATAPLRKASAADGSGDAFALWAGQGVGLARAETTAEVIARLVRETEAILGR